ncbi:MAG: hypothetical protein ACPID2_04725 [Candidatus Puniceispirillum sp.]
MEREPTSKDGLKPLNEGVDDFEKLKPKVKPSKKPKDDKKSGNNDRSASEND